MSEKLEKRLKAQEEFKNWVLKEYGLKIEFVKNRNPDTFEKIFGQKLKNN